MSAPLPIVLASTLAILALAGCKQEDMYTQQSSRTWDRNRVFEDGTSMRHPVAGTVARDAPNPPAPQPPSITADLVSRGQQRFDIFCTACHGAAGNGQGMIVQRGFPQAPSFVQGKLRDAKAEVFWNAMTQGYGAMYSFATRISPNDRWAVIAYVRALQLSQNTEASSLPPEDQARLVEAAR